MLFNSYEFILIFLPLVLIGFFYLSAKGESRGILWLVISSVFFYSWWSWSHAIILIISILMNFLFSRIIFEKYLNPKIILIFSISTNLCVLAFFKYFNFLINSILFGSNWPDFNYEIELPLGISFFTFTQIAFLVDVYSNKAKEPIIGRYFLFVTYFPHLIAGPLIHHSQMMPQFILTKIKNIRKINLIKGFGIFTVGLAKKLILADNLAVYANGVFDAAKMGVQPDFIASWTGALAYTLQLYFDFSGYCDMAIGISLMFGIKLPINFNSPYKASNIIDFWKNWHITLSTFLRNYLYIPIGGNRKGPLRRHFNIFVTMLLGGLWHGASWNFVIWGGLHGVFIVINHCWNQFVTKPFIQREKIINKIYSYLMVPFTFFFVVLGWVIFRASNFESSLLIYKGCFGYGGLSLPSRFKLWINEDNFLFDLFNNNITFNGTFFNIPDLASVGGPIDFILIFTASMFIIWTLPNTQEFFSYKEYKKYKSTQISRFVRWRPNIFYAITNGILFCICFGSIEKISPFLYYQF
ncbi:MBOAT family protein [Alphaproteobacteria bacterium]|nr:MBOAT family protein [Alphaproteobacteria bacterium]